MGMKKAKITAIIEYSDSLPWDDVAVGSYIERQCKYKEPNPPHAEITIRVTKVEVQPHV